MVVFKAKESYFSGTMHLMNTLRRDGSFCDITLTVGDEQLQAHRCVLASGSQYFHSLFLGQFKEAKMQSINLSEVTNDMDALGLIVDFIYSGVIDITESNLGVVVKLSTFFLIEPLRQFCLEFMKKTLNLKTCLRLFLYAVEHNLSVIEEDAKLMVRSRFHDFIILEDIIALSPDEILYLMSNDIFQHCTADSILQFMAEYVIDGLTEKHVSVASEVLDTVRAKSLVQLPYNSVTDKKQLHISYLLDRLKLHLTEKKVKSAEKFLKKYQQILTKLFPKRDAGNKNYNLRTSSSPKPQTSGVMSETVIVTLSPKQCLIDTIVGSKSSSFRSSLTFTEPVFSMCWYSPRYKTWYHIQDFEAEGVTGELSEELYFGAWMFAMYKEELVLMSNSDDMYFYDLRENSWRTLRFSEHIENDLEDNEGSSSYDHCFVAGHDSSIYLIAKVKIFESTEFDDPVGEYFKGYKLADDGQTWHTIFKTEVERSHCSADSEIHARISTISNELIFTHGPTLENGFNYVYIVNLKESQPLPTKISQVYTTILEQGLKGVKILETRHHFYIVYDGTVSSGGNVQIKYEYKFNSLCLTEPRDSSLKALRIHKIEDNSLNDDMFPCCNEFTVDDGKSLWCFEGDSKTVSFLYEVSMNRNRSLSYREHTPPPFPCVTAMFAGEVSTDLLDQMNPISKFMLSQ